MASRNCSYCGKELTDAASINAGIGPVCRKMENYVLAQLIPADVGLARYCFRRLTEGEWSPLPDETSKTLINVGKDLENTDNNDWRETCKRVEWLLSFSMGTAQRDALISIVDALGYVSLASLLKGEAAKGLATISFENGRLFIQGPRNTSGRLAIKDIKGRKFHPKTATEKARWSVPADAHEEFKNVVWKHWPKNEGLTDALSAAQGYSPSVTEVIENTQPMKPEPKVVVTKDGNVLKIASPYNKEFIASLKGEIQAWKERRWNPSEKVWEVAADHAELVQTLVAKHYGEQVSL